jgi:hypothetical protein
MTTSPWPRAAISFLSCGRSAVAPVTFIRPTQGLTPALIRRKDNRELEKPHCERREGATFGKQGENRK